MFIRKRYWIGFGLVIVFVLGTFWLLVLRGSDWSDLWKIANAVIENEKNVAAWAAIVTALTTVGAASYAVVQYLDVRRVRRQEKAAEILRMYATRLMYHVGVIYRIFQDYDEIDTIVQKIDRNEPLRFTRDELAKYSVTDKDIKTYTEFLFSHQIKTMEQKQEKAEDGGKDQKANKSKDKEDEDGKPPLYIDFLPKDAADNIPKDCTLAAYIAVTLNELEHLSMEIESEAADDNYLYGSLHQSFLPFVHSAAMLIQKMNIRSVDDENYYPYVSRLYRRWVTKENENHKFVSQAFRTSEKTRKRHERVL